MNTAASTSLAIYVVSVMACAFTFIALGIYSLKRKDPMHFWAGSKVPPEKVSDISRYNRANGIMWIVAGLLFAADALLAFYDVFTAGMVLLALCLGGAPCLILVYRSICKKYFV